MQAVNASLSGEVVVKPNLETNAILDTTPGCIIISKGKINCSNEIYHDRKTWRRSRNQIDSEIQRLKEKLENLKEIRRHLKHTKPNSEGLDEDEDSDQSDETDEDILQFLNATDNVNNNINVPVDLSPPNVLSHFEIVNVSENVSTTEYDVNVPPPTTNAPQRKRKKNPTYVTSRPNRRRRPSPTFNSTEYNDVNTTTPFEEFSKVNYSELLLSTEKPRIQYTTHHRHHHHHHHHKHHNVTKRPQIQNATEASTFTTTNTPTTINPSTAKAREMNIPSTFKVLNTMNIL